MPKILNIEEFCENLKEVTSATAKDKKKFHPEGLFSEQIFGPIKNYTCQCGTYYGVSRAIPGNSCKTCKVDITNSDERRRRFAKIILPLRVVNPIMYDLVCDVAGSQIKDIIDKLMKNEKTILCKDGIDYVIITDPEARPDLTNRWEGIEAISELVNTMANNNSEHDPGWKIVKDNIDNLLINKVIVLPADLRPMSKEVDTNYDKADKINSFYSEIITKCQVMRNTMSDIQANKNLYYTYYKQLQKSVNELYDHIMEKLSKKEGLLRGNILGKRIDFSGRAVIIPDPTITLDECVLPYTMILELFKLQISKRLIQLGKFRILNEAIDYVDNCSEIKDLSLYKVAEEIIKDEVCILNRQPSLHRLSMLGFKIRMSPDDVIKIHPLVCAPFNADFDGDQMAVYVPISEESKQEVRDKILASKNLTSPANQSLTVTPSQDIVLGVYTLTDNKFKNLLGKTNYKGAEVTGGVKLFNECLPNDYPLVNKTVTKSVLIEILNDIKDRYEPEVARIALDKIKELGFKYSTLHGSSMSLGGFIINGTKELRDNIYSKEDIREQLTRVSSKTTEDYMKKNFEYSYLISSGARGKWDQARQIVLTRGFISNFNGQILNEPVKHSLLEGLTKSEFFNSTYGCRKGLLDVAVNTGESGFLSRKLVFTCVNLCVSEDVKDCKSTQYLDVFVKNEKKAQMLIGRYYLNDDTKKLDKILKTNYKEFIGKLIRLRSPIFCKSEEICHTCYGDLRKSLHSKYAGVVAAQSLGETNTQLILRVFHTSGVAVIDEENVDMKQADIIGDLSTVSKLLHVKNKSKLHENISEFTQNLFEVYNSSKDIHHVHLECVVSQMMWKGNKKWRLLENRHQVVPEFYSVQTTPEKESWILGLGFSYPKKHILKGIQNPGHYKGIIDKILYGEKLY